MSKIIPLTTEIAIRQHTRKLVLESIKRILKENPVTIDLNSKKAAEEAAEKVEEVNELLEKHGTDIAIANYLIVARAEMMPLFDRINWCLTFPVYDHAFMELYGLLYGLVVNDESDLRYTRAMLSIFGERNEDFTEFLSNTINPLDPLNWGLVASIVAAPFTGGVTLGATATILAAKGLASTAKSGGKQAVKRLLFRAAQGQSKKVTKDTAETMGRNVVKSQSKELADSASRSYGISLSKRFLNTATELGDDELITFSKQLKRLFPTSSGIKSSALNNLDTFITGILSNNTTINKTIVGALKQGDSASLRAANREVLDLLSDETDNMIDLLVDSMNPNVVTGELKEAFKAELKGNKVFRSSLENYAKIQSNLVLESFKVSGRNLSTVGKALLPASNAFKALQRWTRNEMAPLLSRAGKESLEQLSKTQAKEALIDAIANNKDALKNVLKNFEPEEIISLMKSLKNLNINEGDFLSNIRSFRRQGFDFDVSILKSIENSIQGADDAVVKKLTKFLMDASTKTSTGGMNIPVNEFLNVLKALATSDNAIAEIADDVIMNQAKRGVAEGILSNANLSIKMILYTKLVHEILGVGRTVAIKPQAEVTSGQTDSDSETQENTVSELTEKQKEEAKLLGQTFNDYANEISKSLSEESQESLITDEDELEDLVTKSSDAFYSGYEDGFDLGDVIAALNYYDAILLNWTNMGNEISRLADYWNISSWQREMAGDIHKVTFIPGAGYRDLEWAEDSDNYLGLKSDMNNFADSSQLNSLVRKLSDIIKSIANGKTSQSQVISAFKAPAASKGIQDTKAFMKILDAGANSSITNFSSKSKKNMNSLYNQIGVIAKEKQGIDENKSFKLNQKTLRKIIRKNILSETLKKKRNKLILENPSLTFKAFSKKVFSVFSGLSSNPKDLKGLFKPTVRNWLIMNKSGEVSFDFGSGNNTKNINYQKLKTAAVSNIIKKLNKGDTDISNPGQAKSRIMKNGHEYIQGENTKSQTKDSRFQIILACLEKSKISGLNDLKIDKFKIHNYDLKTDTINEIFEEDARLDITSSPMLRGIVLTKQDDDTYAFQWDEDGYKEELKSKINTSDVFTKWNDDDLKLSIPGTSLSEFASKVIENSADSSDNSFNPFSGNNFIIPLISFVSSNKEVSGDVKKVSTSNLTDYLKKKKSIKDFEVLIPEFLSTNTGITGEKYQNGYSVQELSRGIKDENIFIAPITNKLYEDISGGMNSGFSNLVKEIENNNTVFYNSLSAEEVNNVSTTEVEQAEVAESSESSDSTRSISTGLSAEEKRQKQKDWVQNMANNEHTPGAIVDLSPGSESRTNILIYEMSLAFYLYRYDLEEKIKDLAPRFYKGMWTSGWGKGYTIGLSLGDATAQGYQAMEEIVINHAIDNEIGVFKDPEVVKATKGQISNYRWRDFSPLIVNVDPVKYGKYDVTGDRKVYSAALFFKDLVNDTYPPSEKGSSKSKKSSRSKGSGGKGRKIKSGERNLARQNTGSGSSGSSGNSGQYSRIVIQGETSSGNLYKAISKQALESIFTKHAPSDAVYDKKSTAKVKIKFDKSGKFKTLEKESSVYNIGKVITTSDTSVFNSKVAQWIRAINKELKSKKISDESLSNGEVIITFKNSSMLNRRTMKESFLRKKVKISKAFKR